MTEDESINNESLENEVLDSIVFSMQERWHYVKEPVSSWKFYKKFNFTPMVKFLTKCLDDLIIYVDNFVDVEGAKKKEIVLEKMVIIYTYVTMEGLPLFLRPLAFSLKHYIIYVLVSSMIDWIVEKYRNGEWRTKSKDDIQAQWLN